MNKFKIKEKVPRPIEIGDYVVMVVPPFIRGYVTDTYKGKYVDEVTLERYDTKWGFIMVGAKHVWRVRVYNPDELVQGDGSEFKEKVA